MHRIKSQVLVLCWLNYWLVKCSNSGSFEGKIIGGEYASIRDHPHAVLLRMTKYDRSSHICGSSVLSQKILLTAAHCFYKREVVQTMAFAGHEDLRMSPLKREALKFLLHENYHPPTLQNDIALVVLKHSLPLGRYIKRIILKNSWSNYVTATVAGWGYTGDDKATSTFLKSVTQTIYSTESCIKMKLQPGMLCAGSLASTDPRPAQGDSGSGLVTNKYEIIGLLSYRNPLYPASPVYTNVTYFYHWINWLINEDFCNLTESNSTLIKN